MSHPPLSLMNRLSKAESAVFNLRKLYFQRIFFFFTDNLIGNYLTKYRLRNMLYVPCNDGLLDFYLYRCWLPTKMFV